jgi:hypothetical protein
MGVHAEADTGAERFRRALAGERVLPPVTGITFVEDRLLRVADAAADPARRLAQACLRAHLDFAFVEARRTWGASAVAALRDAGVASAWVVPGIFGALLDPTAPAEALRTIARGGEGISAALDAALDMATLEVRRGIDAGVSAIVVADDMAGSHGPLADPAFLEENVLRRLARLAAIASDAGLPAILHCDGEARFLMVFAARAGFTALHGDAGGPSGVERALLSARVAGISFMGGIPTAELSGEPRPELARWRDRALGSGKGLLLSDDGGVTTDDEVQALLAVLRAVREGFG